MKSRYLGAVAAFAFVATGLAAHAQDAQKQENRGAEHSPGAAAHGQEGGAMQRQEGGSMQRQGGQKAEGAGAGAQRQETPRSAETQPQNGNAATSGKEGQKAEGAGPTRNETPRAAETEHKDNNGANSRKDAKDATSPKGEERRSAEGERREQDGAQRKDATRAEAQRNESQKNEAQRNDTQRNETTRGAQTDKRSGSDNMRQGQAGESRGMRGEPHVKGVKISSEHATRIGETLRHSERAEHVNFEIRVGTRVPQGFAIHPLPPEIVEIEPEYRGYDYFVDTNDEIVFVSPQTHEIVGTIDYEGRAAAVDSPRAARPCPSED